MYDLSSRQSPGLCVFLSGSEVILGVLVQYLRSLPEGLPLPRAFYLSSHTYVRVLLRRSLHPVHEHSLSASGVLFEIEPYPCFNRIADHH